MPELPAMDPAEERRAVATACMSGVNAILYVTDPARWPAFAAFAAQHMGEAWTEQDRKMMRNDGRVLNGLAGTLDAAAAEEGPHG